MADNGQNSRGEDTRNLLLEAGLVLFGQRGFDAVTTRQLSEHAGANVAAIAYHFGGKRELYRAVLRQLVDDIAAREMPAVMHLQKSMANPDQPDALASGLSKFIADLTRFFIDDAFMRDRAPLILREFAMPSEDFDIFYDGWLHPVHTTMTKIVAAALGRDASEPECAIRAHTVMGQIMVFGIARVVLFRRLDWDGYNTERANIVANEVSQSVLASLNLPIPKEKELEVSHGH